MLSTTKELKNQEKSILRQVAAGGTYGGLAPGDGVCYSCGAPSTTVAKFCHHYSEAFGPNTTFVGMSCGKERPSCERCKNPPPFED